MGKKKTHEEYITEVKGKFPQIEVLGKYKDSHTKILHKCLVDNYIWNVAPTSILSGHGCPKCTNHYQMNHKEFLNCLSEDIMQKVIILSEYKGRKKSITCQCKICGKIWNTIPERLLKGNGCKSCAIIKTSQSRKISHNEFIKSIKDTKNQNVDIVGKYNGSHNKIACKCKICGYTWNADTYIIKNGAGCRKCAAKQLGIDLKKTDEDFIKELKESNPFIKPLEPYNGANNKIKMCCTVCNNVWYVTPAHILRYTGCPVCASSKGEKKIAKWLDINNIFYNSQKTFDNLLGINNGKLSYDFYLPQHNLLIEFQGEQHEHPVDYFGGKQQFEIQKEHDKRKRDYAEQNKISLLEIWYYDIDNIEPILLQKIKEINENNLKLESVETVTVA